MSQGIDYDAIRRRVEKRIKARQEWLGHLSAYVIVNLMFWVMWVFTGAEFPWPVFITLPWGIGIGIHTMSYFLENNAERAKEEAIEREIRREKMRLYGDPDFDDSLLEKPKRRAKERAMRLTDDGELAYDEDAAESTAVSKQKGR